jgi:hypothetical protein
MTNLQNQWFISDFHHIYTHTLYTIIFYHICTFKTPVHPPLNHLYKWHSWKTNVPLFAGLDVMWINLLHAVIFVLQPTYLPVVLANQQRVKYSGSVSVTPGWSWKFGTSARSAHFLSSSQWRSLSLSPYHERCTQIEYYTTYPYTHHGQINKTTTNAILCCHNDLPVDTVLVGN